MPIPTQSAKGLNITKLKGLNNLEIEFGPKPLTAIMGINGCGKTTILHALACCYQPYNGHNSKNHVFSEYFTPNTDSKWAGSKFVFSYDHHLATQRHPNSREYKKDADRWAPRYTTRLQRWVSYIGVRDAVPAIEELKTKSFITLNKTARADNAAQKILADASVVMNRNYTIMTNNAQGRYNYVGVQYSGDDYSAISMGSGEQRIFKILEVLHKAPDYGLILIDEIELLLHTGALKRLINILYREATAKHLQIVFTTHAESVLELTDQVSINHIFIPNTGNSLCFKNGNPKLLYALTGVQIKPLKLFVEDELSKEIVYKIAGDLGIRKHIEVGIFGPAINCFTTAAGAVLSGSNNVSNCLFIIDGDLYRTHQQKKDRMNAVLTGSDFASRRKKVIALKQVSQFILPAGTGPERYFHSIITALPPLNNGIWDEIIGAAQDINAVPDTHHFIDDIIARLGYAENDYKEVVGLLSSLPFWLDYTEPVRTWLQTKQAELNLN
ncbi:ATP-dependent nuclease [Pedobacter polysacchareus]|uniref:ATP-dependent nuclease n=1 Tax=Pedobacter polysacchareus TaxID=2861973 RepID=UPI001C9966C0|nr:AAA family ATPase [Pedobacter polysacchareus]